VYRVKILLFTRRLYLQTQQENLRLEERVRERTRALEEAQRGAFRSLAVAGEYRDDETGRHADRVGELSADLARELGLDDSEVWLIRHAAPLHDLGKIGIPDAILRKPGKLTPEEMDVMKTHTAIGAAILAGGGSAVLQLGEVVALTHHERWDGEGYPTGLAGGEIPLVGRIVSVADAFDAMTHSRPYRTSVLSAKRAAAEIDRLKGAQFDPTVTSALVSRVTALKHQPRVLRQEHRFGSGDQPVTPRHGVDDAEMSLMPVSTRAT